jgi:integrase
MKCRIPAYAAQQNIDRYEKYLREAELAPATIDKYVRAIQNFAGYTNGRPITKEIAIAWKAELEKSREALGTNPMVAAANGFFGFLGLGIKLKGAAYADASYMADGRALAAEEIEKLLAAAKKLKSKRLYHIVKTLALTGIRVSELQFVTVEAIEKGEAVVKNKKMTRKVYIAKALGAQLLGYAKDCGIVSGCIFVTKSGKCVDRSNVWREIQKLCGTAEVDKAKGHPHNFRRYFAVRYYREKPDLAELAIALGHKNVKTTMKYIRQIGAEIRRTMEKMSFAE